jgi:uncharacterized protein YndB with AHSA1/START domain
MNEYGVVTEPGTLRLERMLPGPIERVWDYLTESKKRGTWLAAGTMELHVGGKVELNFHNARLSAETEIPERFREKRAGHVILDGRVTACDPPRLLSYTFGDTGEVTFELTPKGKHVLLVLTHRRLPDRAAMLSVASGWHSHIAILIDTLNGNDPRPFWTTVAEMEAEYEKRLPQG